MALLDLISWLATVCTVGLFLAWIPTARKIIHKGTTADVSFFPLICFFCSSVFWLKYALLKGDKTIQLVNSIGAVMNFIYMILYHNYTLQKTGLYRLMIIAASIVFPVLIYVKFYTVTRDQALSELGVICSTTSIIAFGSPLVSLGEVFRTKSTECIPFALSLANFVVGGEWLIYGYLVADMYILIPNAMGFLLGGIQVSLFVVYPSRKAVTFGLPSTV